LNGGRFARSRYKSTLTPSGASRAKASNAGVFVDARRRLPEMASNLMGLPDDADRVAALIEQA
jgi:hypothetical protein